MNDYSIEPRVYLIKRIMYTVCFIVSSSSEQFADARYIPQVVGRGTREFLHSDRVIYETPFLHKLLLIEYFELVLRPIEQACRRTLVMNFNELFLKINSSCALISAFIAHRLHSEKVKEKFIC